VSAYGTARRLTTAGSFGLCTSAGNGSLFLNPTLLSAIAQGYYGPDWATVVVYPARKRLMSLQASNKRKARI